MAKELSNNTTQTVFEQLKRVDEYGNEYWSARDLSKVLEYSEYRHFLPVIARAKEACSNSGQLVEDHFEDILEMVPIGSGAKRKSESVKLSRYASYLIVQNADPNKEIADIGIWYGIETTVLKTSVDNVMSRMIFDGEKLTDLLEPLDLGWKERREKELALMADLVPQLQKLAEGREISGLAAYE